MSNETGDSPPAPAPATTARRCTCGGTAAAPPPQRRRQLRLNNQQNTRRSLASLIRELHRSEPDPDRISWFRALVYGCQTLLSYDKATEQSELGERLEAIESRLDAAGK